MPTSLEELEKLLLYPKESKGLEFKEAKNQLAQEKFFDYCVAIANERGGRLVLGVTDAPPRQVVGTSAVRDPGGMVEKVLQVLGFRVDIDELAHADGRVLVIHIPSRPIGTPLEHDGKYLMRAGESLVSMSPDQLRKIFDEGKPDYLAEMATGAISDQDVIELLDTQTFFELEGRPYPSSREEVLVKLEKEHLIEKLPHGYRITNLGALLCAKRLENFGYLARRAPRVVVYDGSGKTKTTLDTPGGKGYAIGFSGLVSYVSSHLPQNEVIENALRTKAKMLPDDALREVIANALVHQDFTESGTSVMIEIYADRVEISSPSTGNIDAQHQTQYFAMR